MTGDISSLIPDTSSGTNPDEVSRIRAEMLVAIGVGFLGQFGHSVWNLR